MKKLLLFLITEEYLNLYNVIARFSVGRILEIPKEVIKITIEKFQYHLGRFEKFYSKEKDKILALVKILLDIIRF